MLDLLLCDFSFSDAVVVTKEAWASTSADNITAV